MEYKSSLSRRIVVSFVLLTTLVSGLFGLGIVFSVEFFEEILVSTELEQELSLALKGLEKKSPVPLGEGTRFLVDDGSLPPYLRDVGEGFSEIVLENQAYHVFMRRVNGMPYVLLKEQTSFERREKTLHLIVFCSFVGSVVASILLSRAVARKIIAPLRRLTTQVRDREKMLPGTPPLSSDYADDEIGHLARTFDKTFGMLREDLQRESLFTSDASHELRTPLMIVQSSCDLLLEKKQLDDYARQRVQIISKATKEMRELVNAFLTLARRQGTETEIASLREIVRSEIDGWKSQAEGKGLSFVLRNPSAQDDAGDLYPAALLRTVLNNLIRNAIHHTEEGEITLALTASGFEVRDTGPGIREADKATIFEPFYRGAPKSRDGMGLGLSLVQRICKREGWTITLRDNQPTGCCFSVLLKPPL